ncbi:tenascin [Apostichopus japonicus]|uniref:Tenascin n=1 Tax=Stichopus japonicus TaxID=307972 RepID=A0A2G8JT76_STIJA|nr:tenascin [Apostichopus japonicus]
MALKWLTTSFINVLNIQRTAETFKASVLRLTLAEYTLLSQMALKNHLRSSATTTLGRRMDAPPDPTCPRNTIYGTCSCKATCEDPNGQSGCNRDCLGSEGCTCPAGFLMQGSDCISASECGCFVAEANLVLPNGETFVNDDCTQKCSCNNNQLTCEDYRCSTNAVCDVRDGVRNVLVMRDMKVTVKLVHPCSQTARMFMKLGIDKMAFIQSCLLDGQVFQRRTDDSVDFYRNWDAYKNGFGNDRNLWLGNEKLYYLTNQRNYKLRFDITTSDGSAKYAEYPEFQIESESSKYRMNKLGTHSGNTGNYLYYSKGKQFSTRDRDNDACGNFNCAEKHRSGWWHYDNDCSYCYSSSYCYYFQYSSSCKSLCAADNLNGVYNGGNGEMIFSYYYYYNYYCSPQFVEMKIRPTS